MTREFAGPWMSLHGFLDGIGVRTPDEVRHLRANMTATEWACACGCSRSTLRRRLIVVGAHSIQRYQQLARLVPALMAIEQGARYADAAYAVGYPDPFQFSEQCRRVLGIRPAAVRAGDDWRERVRRLTPTRPRSVERVA